MVCCSVSVALAQSSALTLEPNAPVERALKTGESHSYRTKLKAGESLHAIITPKGIPVVVTIYRSTERQLAASYGSFGGVQRIFFVAEAAGDYRLEVRANYRADLRGRYELKIAVQPASDDDRARYLAQELLAGINQSAVIENGTTQARKDGIEKCEKALEIWRKIGDRTGEADAHYVIGLINSRLDVSRAIDDFEQALIIARSLGDRWREETILEGLGEAYEGLGDMYQSVETHRQSLELARALGDRPGEVLNLYEIALSYKNLGDVQQALDYNSQLLKISGADDTSRILPLHSLCQNFLLLGEPETALEYCGRALPVWRALGKRLFEAATLSYIGQAYALKDDSAKELDYYNQALVIFRDMEDKLGEGSMLRSIGQWYQLHGDHQRALEYHDQALHLFEAISNLQQQTTSLRLVGQVYSSLGNNEKALNYFQRALSLVRSLRDQSNEAATLLALARVERDLGQLKEARREIEAALGILESLSARVTRLDWRASYLGTKHEYYEFYIDLLMSMAARQPNEGFAAQAFEVSERARARSLMESLAGTRVDLQSGVDAALIAREATIKQQLNVNSIKLTQRLGSEYRAEDATAARDEIDALLQSYAEVEAEIRLKNPHYASLHQPQALSLSEVQRKLLDQDTLLLEYSLGETRSFVWAVTSTSIKSFELPRRSVIEKAARQTYETLTARSKSLSNETAEQKQRRIERADSEAPRAAEELSRIVLGPIASELAGKRLLIVSEGALQYVPFSALPLPQLNSKLESQDFTPLIVDHEVVSLPSISVLARLREETARRQAAARTVAVLADPVFSRDDARFVGAPAVKRRDRLKPNGSPSSQIPNDVLRSAAESGLKDFVRLRFSRAEADAITQLAPKDQGLEAVDFLANRATATSADLSQYRIVHFATHALLNSQHPELSGIVLSLLDQHGQSQNGFLRLYEIYDLKLNADLVVLSACQTALGKEIKGEGLIGLTRGFMYAGAPRVVASLWRIDDRATAELMRSFYQGMLKDKLPPAAALRAAQISMWRSQRWTAPPYWAAFTIQGEWK